MKRKKLKAGREPMPPATTYGSVCSGIEAATVAWEPLGMKAAWFSEIEAYPSSVLQYHYPSVPNLGDMRLIARAVLTGEVKAPDVLVGGTPCQAFSLAGLREALDDERGQLTLTYMRLLDAIDFIRGRNNQPPCIAVWENVPGVLSTKDNAFGCFLAGLAGEDVPLKPPGKKWAHTGFVHGPKRTIAWRTMDAQYLGLAQQRKRVFVVASARKGFDPSSVLFEWDGVRRDSAPRREPQTHVAALTANGVGTCGADDNQAQAGHLIAASTGDISHCLNAGGMGRIDYETETFITHAVAPTITSGIERPRGDGGDVLEVECFTDTRGDNRGSGVQTTGDIANTLHCAKGISEQQAVAYRVHGENSNAMKGDVANVADPVDVSRCLDTTGGYSHNQGRNVVLQAVCVTGDITHTLKAEGFDASEDGTGRGQPIVPVSQEVADTLTSSWHNSNGATAGNNPGVINPIIHGLRVRRLMPMSASACRASLMAIRTCRTVASLRLMDRVTRRWATRWRCRACTGSARAFSNISTTNSEGAFCEAQPYLCGRRGDWLHVVAQLLVFSACVGPALKRARITDGIQRAPLRAVPRRHCDRAPLL